MQKLRLALVLVFSFGLIFGLVSAPARAADDTLNIGAIAWEEALAIADLIKYVTRERLNYNVEVINPSAGPAYQAISDQELDLMVEVWQPRTDKTYLQKYSADALDFGPMYENAKLTWAVPAYVPKDKLNSISDLGKPEVKKKLDKEIIGIDPGAGLMRRSEDMMEQYDALSDYTLVEGSGAAMQASLKDAIMNDEWIVVTLWQPHSAYGQFELRNLKEPKHLLGLEERVHLWGRIDFMEVFPDKVSQFLSRFYLPMEMVNNLSAMYAEMGEGTGAKWAKNHPQIIDYFVNGVEAYQ